MIILFYLKRCKGVAIIFQLVKNEPRFMILLQTFVKEVQSIFYIYETVYERSITTF